jgi:hypothetical protein
MDSTGLGDIGHNVTGIADNMTFVYQGRGKVFPVLY